MPQQILIKKQVYQYSREHTDKYKKTLRKYKENGMLPEVYDKLNKKGVQKFSRRYSAPSVQITPA